MKKITVLTPTYNDEDTITETLKSLINQTFDNWESIIIDDGSTDNTKYVIEDFKNKYDKNNKIKYIYQNNQDQLNAIINGLAFATGDYIFVLHSDDLLPGSKFFEQIIKEAEKSECDAIIGDLEIIDKNSKVVNYWKALKYNNKKNTPIKLLLNEGANIYGDVALWKKDIYLSRVKNNYLLWNTPFWIDLQKQPDILNVKNAKFPILKYRIHQKNYINDAVGKFNVLNGELRTLTILLSYYKIPLFKFQKCIWNFLRMKGIRKLHLCNYYTPIYFNKETKNKYKIIKNKIKKIYGEEFKNNIFLTSILEFYNKENNRTISLRNLNKDDIYMGKDIRKFTNNMFNNTLPEIYYYIFSEMQKGFNKIVVENESDKELAIKLIKFLCIYPSVKVSIK